MHVCLCVLLSVCPHPCRCVGYLPLLVSMAGHCENLCSAHSLGLLYYVCTHSDHGSGQSQCKKIMKNKVSVDSVINDGEILRPYSISLQKS